MSYSVPDPNPHNLTFPYPLNGPEPSRPRGEGCLVCVHQTYCPAVYWFYRFIQNNLTPTNGVRCLSYSVNPVDKITAVKQPELDENEYLAREGISEEARPSGIVSPTTGNAGKY